MGEASQGAARKRKAQQVTSEKAMSKAKTGGRRGRAPLSVEDLEKWTMGRVKVGKRQVRVSMADVFGIAGQSLDDLARKLREAVDGRREALERSRRLRAEAAEASRRLRALEKSGYAPAVAKRWTAQGKAQRKPKGRAKGGRA